MHQRLYNFTVWIFAAVTVCYLVGIINSLFYSKTSTTNIVTQPTGLYLWQLFVSTILWLTMVLVIKRLAIWIISRDFSIVPKLGNTVSTIIVVSYFFVLLAIIAFVGTMLFMVTATSDAEIWLAFLSIYGAPVMIGLIAAPGIFMLIPTLIWVELFSIRNEGFLPNLRGNN